MYICTFTEVIAKLKQGYHFFWTTRYAVLAGLICTGNKWPN